MRRDAVLNIRLPIEVKDALHAAAEADHGRSASSMAVRIFREWLGDRGYLPPAEGSSDLVVKTAGATVKPSATNSKASTKPRAGRKGRTR